MSLVFFGLSDGLISLLKLPGSHVRDVGKDVAWCNAGVECGVSALLSLGLVVQFLTISFHTPCQSSSTSPRVLTVACYCDHTSKHHLHWNISLFILLHYLPPMYIYSSSCTCSSASLFFSPPPSLFLVSFCIQLSLYSSLSLLPRLTSPFLPSLPLSLPSFSISATLSPSQHLATCFLYPSHPYCSPSLPLSPSLPSPSRLSSFLWTN